MTTDDARTNTLYYGDNLAVLRDYVPDESVDLVYLDPPFNSNASYNVLFKERTGEESPAQIQGVHRHLGVDAGDGADVRAGHHRERGCADGGEGDDFRLPPVHREQRNDGVLGDEWPRGWWSCTGC